MASAHPPIGGRASRTARAAAEGARERRRTPRAAAAGARVGCCTARAAVAGGTPALRSYPTEPPPVLYPSAAGGGGTNEGVGTRGASIHRPSRS
jgi:hypothetical protein